MRNTVYLSEEINVLKKKEKFDEELLKHLSPVGWEHIDFLGEYKFEGLHETVQMNLRPLRIKKPFCS